MLARWRGRKRGAVIVVAAGLAAVLVATAMAASLGFPHIRSNLSQTETGVSARPGLAVSSDGDRVVVVWTEEYRDGSGSKGHVYLRAASEAGGGWGSKITVFSGSDSACAYKAAVAVTGATAHVAYVVFSDSCGVPTQMQVRYKTCDLSGGTCDGGEETVASVGTLFYTISWVDLTLDTGGNPHLVWVRKDQEGNYGDIRYRSHNGTGWAAPEGVETSWSNDMPAIAWADGYAHVVWEEEAGYVRYRRRDTTIEEEAEAWGSILSLSGPSPQAQYPPGNPDVAAGTGRVFVVWNWCSDGQAPCGKYKMVYRRSNDSGSNSSWGTGDYGNTREVGTEKSIANWPDMEDYDSADEDGGRDCFLQYLQPCIALNGDGWPAVAWHADRSGGAGTDYTIYYSYATSGSSTHVGWIPPATLDWDQPALLGSAGVGVREPDPGGEQYLHFAYMQQPSEDVWEVYYDTNEEPEPSPDTPYAHISVAGVVLVGSTVTLDGSGSYDPQGLDLTYAWSLTVRPAGSGATLSNPSAVSPVFTADVVGNYVVTLQVDNGAKTSSLKTRTIVCASEDEVEPPQADISAAGMVEQGSTVTLDGSGSYDPQGLDLTYAWSLTGRPAGSGATLSDPTAVLPVFTADVVGNYVVTLQVHNGAKTSLLETRTIIACDVVYDVNLPLVMR